MIEAQGLRLGKDGKYTLWAGTGRIERGRRYEFTVDAERVTGLAPADRDTCCS
ncbi:hypothetical protein [Streptomyces sp. TLI_053]|uniref:hypothetical protein n=1 Tax=Streptomyces sp. TLI_053 TaxID=1855352 RepID=UPI001352084A|nr:hypothetical protein [Streptomyces sp. TLI_053]